MPEKTPLLLLGVFFIVAAVVLVASRLWPESLITPHSKRVAIPTSTLAVVSDWKTYSNE
jgi:hypothetical protein